MTYVTGMLSNITSMKLATKRNFTILFDGQWWKGIKRKQINNVTN